MPMPIKMRPTGLSSGFYKDTVDYSIFCGASGASAAFTKPPAAPSLALVLSALRSQQAREHTHLEPSGDAGRG